MKSEIWKEFWEEIDLLSPNQSGAIPATTLYRLKKNIELRTLPERVAEILDRVRGTVRPKWDKDFGVSDVECILIDAAQALRSGDTSEIEKWVKK